MHLLPRTIREGIPRVHREGIPFIVGTVILAVAFGILWEPAFWLLMFLVGWMVIFFRNPVRVVPMHDGLVVSPADGRVEPIIRCIPPFELGLGDEPLTRVSVFMNIFDCHISRAPVAGRVRRIVYTPGKFFSADMDKASDDNERNAVVIDADRGLAVGVVQIAGLVARRIVCWTKEGDRLRAGERFGMIRFGSRLDVYLPEGSVVTTTWRQRAVSGETILAHLPGGQPSAPFQTRFD